MAGRARARATGLGRATNLGRLRWRARDRRPARVAAAARAAAWRARAPVLPIGGRHTVVAGIGAPGTCPRRPGQIVERIGDVCMTDERRPKTRASKRGGLLPGPDFFGPM